MDILTLAVQAFVPVMGLVLIAFGRWVVNRVSMMHSDIMDLLQKHGQRLTALELDQAEMRGYLKAINGRAKGAREK